MSKDSAGSDMTTRLVMAGATLASAVVARRVLQVVWVAATGERPPEDVSDTREVSTGKAIAAATITGVAAGLTRLAAARFASRVRARKEPVEA